MIHNIHSFNSSKFFITPALRNLFIILFAHLPPRAAAKSCKKEENINSDIVHVLEIVAEIGARK